MKLAIRRLTTHCPKSIVAKMRMCPCKVCCSWRMRCSDFCQKQHRFRIREQPMSRFCQAHRVRIAAQEAHFSSSNAKMTADRGLGQSEAMSRRGNAPVLNNADEGAQQKEVVEDAYTVPEYPLLKFDGYHESRSRGMIKTVASKTNPIQPRSSL